MIKKLYDVETVIWFGGKYQFARSTITLDYLPTPGQVSDHLMEALKLSLKGADAALSRRLTESSIAAAKIAKHNPDEPMVVGTDVGLTKDDLLLAYMTCTERLVFTQ